MQRQCTSCHQSFEWAQPGRPSPHCPDCRSRCSVRPCPNGRVAGSSMCSMHKSRAARGKPLDAPVRIKADAATCRLCPREVHARGLCTTHYARAAKDGELPRLYAHKRNARGRINGGGYREVPHPDHPAMVLEHRLVMESAIGRRLRRREQVHHKNRIRTANYPENLELWVKPQPSGQRPEDLAAWVCEYYPELVAAEMKAPQARTADRPTQTGDCPMYVYSANDGLVLNNVSGGTVMMRRGEVWRADDPFVLARPDLFSATPTVLHSTLGLPQLAVTPVGTKQETEPAFRRGRARV